MLQRSRPMPQGVEEIVQQFAKSAFFKSILPNVVENTAKESCSSQSFKMLQNILEHVLTVSPASGPRVLPMAKVLASSLVKNSSGQSAIDFMEKLSMTIAIEVPGVHTDLEALSWRELPLLPVSEEIQSDTCRIETNDLPVIREEGKYQSEEEYLNTYFRLLREECFHKLRKGISEFTKKGKCDSKDVMIYRIALKGLSTLHREYSPTTMSIELEFKLDSQERIDWGSTSWHMFGNLLCISFDESFEHPVWAMVENVKLSEGQSVIWVILCGGKTNSISEAEFITKMQEITDNDFVPFKEFLVYPEAKFMKPADYIDKISSAPDWRIIFESPPDSHVQDESSTYSLLKDYERIKFGTTRNWKIICGCDSCPSFIDDVCTKNIWTHLATDGVFVSFHCNYAKVVTYKNNALDHFLEECLDSSPEASIVRVGGSSNSEKLKECLLKKVGSWWPEPLYAQKRKLIGQLQKMQDQVKEAYLNLQRSSVFNAEMFLKESSESRIKVLLVKRKGNSLDPAEVEKLLNERNADGSYKSHLKGYVENALEEWLPPQDKFDQFASKMGWSGKRRRQTLSASGGSGASMKKKTGKVDQEQENPDDFREPSLEENERLSSALEYDLSVEDMKDVPATYASTGERKLIRIDKRSVEPFRIPLDDTNVWELDEHEKIQLVYALQCVYVEKASSEFLEASQAHVQKHQQYEMLRNKHDIDVMRKYHIIGMTVTGATMRANLLAEIKPSVMIVEEAAEILEAQLVAAIPTSVQHLIMIGDHKQLKPVVQNTRLRRRNNLDLSMFERLVNCDLPLMQLGFQCRMRDEIVELLRKLNIYKELKTNNEHVRNNCLPGCVEKSMYFYDYHTSYESASKDSHSKRNSHEAREITEVAKNFCQEGRVPPSKIAVLCSYRGQASE
ncbi:NFX1-type zinc finger-containing protein 1 [Desmophyllum pertusum]|uniref:NFX1-type zinc finger-containing protein 1 n=1 Tax=Desmophyllum pertusum TaxID=174260 RepID=A0A9W9YBV4_9CNID|nr:NFX1-type zinc finger-containing protein 1 [Desmophyllum pertusum]